MTERRERREFSEEFKQQLVGLYNSGKPRGEIIRNTILWVLRLTGGSRGSTRQDQAMRRITGRRPKRSLSVCEKKTGS